MAHTKQVLTPAVVDTASASSQPRLGRVLRFKKLAAAVSASALISLSVAGGPLAATGVGVSSAAAQNSVLNQTQGGTPTKSGQQQAPQMTTKNSQGADLDVAPNWDAPGISQGKALIGWAKAGAMVLGVLGMIGGIVGGKVLKEAGNHHASGVRATALGIGGAMVIAGAAPTLIPQLMG
jgi:hypothetical protein